MSVSMRMLVLVSLGCLLGVGGCARWTTTSDGDSALKLPLPGLSSDAVVLEVTFVFLPGEYGPADEELWQEIDEQHLPIDVRRRLEANGIRSGLVGSPLPQALRELLDNQQNDASARLSQGEPVLDELKLLERKQLPAGRRGDIVTSQTLDQISLVRLEEGRLVGRTFDQAQCHFAVRSFPQGDGRVRLELSPEVHHGPIRQRYVGDERALRIDAGKGREEFDNLRLETTLSAGQTLIVTCTPEVKGLGRPFFVTGVDGGGIQRRLLLIRLAQTQFDDRFQEIETVEPLVTPAE